MKIWPKDSGWIIIRNITIILIVFMFAGCIFVLFNPYPMEIYGIKFKDNTIPFIIMLAITLLISGMLTKNMFFYIKLEDTRLVVRKKAGFQTTINVKYTNIINVELLYPGTPKTNMTISLYLLFTYKNGKKQKLWVKRYSYQQIEDLCHFIQEKGGLENIDLSRVFNM